MSVQGRSDDIHASLASEFRNALSIMSVCRDNSFRIATRYGLYGPGMESRWGRARFSSSVQTGPGVHPASYTIGTGSFQGVKWPGRGFDHPPHLAPRLKKE